MAVELPKMFHVLFMDFDEMNVEARNVGHACVLAQQVRLAEGKDYHVRCVKERVWRTIYEGDSTK